MLQMLKKTEEQLLQMAVQQTLQMLKNENWGAVAADGAGAADVADAEE
jgi:hypothetical protein